MTVQIWIQLDLHTRNMFLFILCISEISLKQFLILCMSDALDQTRKDCIKPRETAVRARGARLGLLTAVLNKYSSLLGFYTISLGKYFQTFRRIIFPPSSRRVTQEFEKRFLTPFFSFA